MSDPKPKFDFDESFQLRIVAHFVRDTKFAMQTTDLLNPSYFTTDAMSIVMAIAQGHVKTYRSAPEVKLMPMLLKKAIAAKKVRTDVIPEIQNVLKGCIREKLTNTDYILDQVSDFARHQALEEAIFKSVEFLEKGRFDDIADSMQKALGVGVKDAKPAYDYYEEIENRTQQRRDLRDGKIVRNGITTGYSEIDGLLYHYGWGRGELSCMMGAAKSGKSLSLGDFCKNASIAGYNVLYVSLEVATEIIANRVDAAISNTVMNKLHKDPDTVEAAIKSIQAKSGLFKMKDYPTGSMKPSHLRALLDNFRNEGIIFDLVAVDYADIMAAEFRSDSQIENLRTIYIDLRAIAMEYNCAMLTATQTNREGAKAATAKATDVGDDWNKARTVDLLLGLNATDAEKREGKARISWALSRNTEDGFQIQIQQERDKMKFISKVLGRL